MHVESEAGEIGEMGNAAGEAVVEVSVEFGRRRSVRREVSVEDVAITTTKGLP